MSTISMTTDNRYDIGSVYVTEGDALNLIFTRDDSSRDETFYIRLNNFGVDRSYLFPGLDPVQPITVHFAAGDTEPQVVTLHAFDDDINDTAASASASFSLTPAEGSDLTFDILGHTQDHITVGVVDDDNSNVTVSFSNPGNGTATAVVEEGTDLTFSFTRTDSGSGEVCFELRPGDNPIWQAQAKQYYGYDPEHPLTVHFADGETGTKTLTLHALDDHSAATPGAFGWNLVPIAGVTGFDGLEGRPNANPQPDGSLAMLIQFDNDDQPTVGVERFYSTLTGDHFYTANADEAAALKAGALGYVYEGTTLQAMEAGQDGASEVYRFCNYATGDHFFTASVAERDAVMNGDLGYSYEGVGFHASNEDSAGLTEVYRFCDALTGDHFYTSDVAERDTVMSSLPNYHYEGVAFYVPDHAVIA